MLTVNSIDIFAGKVGLLKDISLSVEPGTIMAVVGPNGAGKTSLLKAMSGELNPSKGSVLLRDKKLSDCSFEDRARMIAVLPQQSMLNFSFQVDEVVGLGRYPHATGVQKDAEIINEVLTAVDAYHLKTRDYTTLSGGEKQRVHLARVLAQVWEPVAQKDRFLLLDEPTAALDLAHQHMILQTARSMAQQGVGVLVILHDLNLAAHYADSITMLANGRIAALGPAAKVLTEENITQVFNISVTLIPHPQTERPLIVYRDEVNDSNPDNSKKV